VSDPGALNKDLTAEEFERFRDWIHTHSGIYLEESKLDSLRISLVTRATRFGLTDYAEYYRMLVASEDEFKELMNLVTINETSFFRFPAQFTALRDVVIPEILEHKSPSADQFRVWSAGCSTGEEPYTIAMTLLDSAVSASRYAPYVLGTDVSTSALRRAEQAVYGARSISNLEQSVIQRWFEGVPGGLRPTARVRDLVEFGYHNLIKEPYPAYMLANWDVIFCRNVTIYFRIESTKRVVNNFYDALNPGGYLFIGHSETLSSISDRFEVLEIGGVFLYRKPLSNRTRPVPRPTRPRTRDKAAEQTAARSRSASETAAGAPKLVRLPGGDLSRKAAQATPSRKRTPAQPPAAEPASVASDAIAEHLGEAHKALDEGRPDAARDAASQVLAMDARNVDALLMRANAAADLGDFDGAVADANAALRVNPLLASARYILGIIFLRQGDSQKALNEFKRTIYIDSEFVLAHFNAANVYRARGAKDDACREYENTLRSLYTNPEGEWTAFLGGFRPDLLAKTCERSLIECRRGS
jgi:chemotaxis protein methyltransferase CheR